MKRLLSYLFVAMVLLSCLRQPEEAVVEPEPLPFAVSDTLKQIDSLMQHDADSALMILTSFRPKRNEMERSGEISANFNANYHSLLLSEALYKTDNPQYYRNELQMATRYFDSLAAQYPHNDDLTVFSARSHYMNGVGFYENDSVVEACEQYLQTLEIMEEHFDVEQLTGYKAKFMALTYNRLKELFSDQFMMEPAIYCGKKSLFYCKIAPTSKYGLANNYKSLGMYYDMFGEKDSACFYYKHALDVLPDSNNVVFRNIITHLTILSYYNLDVNSEESIKLLREIAGQTCNDDEKLSRLLSVGFIYYNENQYDSAIIYLKEVFENKDDVVSKFQAAEYLRNIYQELGDTIRSVEYTKYLADNSNTRYDNMLLVSTLDKLFNDFLEHQKEKLYNYNRQKTINVIRLSVVIIVLSIIILITINKIKVKNASIKYNNERQKVSRLEKELIHKQSETERCIESFLNEPVCRKINDMICDIPASTRSNYSDYPGIKLDENTILMLGDAATKHFPNLKSRLISSDVKLKKDDILLCYFYLLGLNNSQIALLRHRSYSTVFRQAERLKNSFKGCKDLPSFIKKIAIS